MTPLELIKKIAAGERDFAMPLTLVMPDGQRLECEQVLRLLPGKRLVLKVCSNGVTQILKLFTPAAARSAKRERDNLQAFASSSIPHARLLAHSLFADGSACHCYEYIRDAESPDIDNPGLIRATGQLIVQMLQTGWRQTDPHPENFLANPQGLWLIDAGSLQYHPQCSKKLVIETFGLWVAQFPLWRQQRIADELVSCWNQLSSASGGINVQVKDIVATARRAWQKRKAAYLKKITRRCTEVDVATTGKVSWKLRREFDGPQLREFLRDPEAVISRGQLCKSGSATHIVRLMLDGREVIVKRYNYRGIWQGFKSLCGLGRARHNWRAAHLLRFCHIATPAPVAMLEVSDGLRITGYIVTCAVPGVEYLHAFDQREPDEQEIDLPIIVLAQLRQCRIEHGDLKAKNLLLDHDRLWLIDLDSLRSDHWLWPWRSQKDQQRFLRNWSSRPELLRRFSERLGSGIGLLAEQSYE